jgi:hypothetical protein
MSCIPAELKSGAIGDNKSMPSAVPKPDEENRIAPTPGPGDFYYEGPYLVFTEQYHLRRGWCCQSGCRHCPYGFVKTELAPASELEPGPEQI